MKTISIPAGYKGIKNELSLSIDEKLAVITGLNGCGKTTILKYIYEQQSDKNKIFFKTTSELNKKNRSINRNMRFSYYSRNEVSIPTFDDVMEAIYTEFERETREQHYTNRYELFSMLFDANSTLYPKGSEFLKILSEGILSELDETNSIKKRLGVPTKDQIKEGIIKKLNAQKDLFDNKAGRKVYGNYVNRNLPESQINYIENIEIKLRRELSVNLRKNSQINSKEKFEKYIYDLVMNYSLSIESVIEKISKRIYEDAKANTSRNEKLWQQINSELKQYNDENQFSYQLNPPSAFSSVYEINFKSIDSERTIHYDSLSSGEKIIFELVCYYFIANNNKKLEMIILDEFDANLNPALTETYIKTIRKQFCQNNITAVLTTHSPSTVAELAPVELFELSAENGEQKITHAKTEDGKKEILKKLAPKFVYYSEFGNLEYILKDRTNTIVLVEGKEDVENFSDFSKQYTFIDCASADNIGNLFRCIKSIPFFKKIFENKLLICLLDFDNEGNNVLTQLINKADDTHAMSEKISKKELPYLQHYKEKYAFFAYLHPNPAEDWDFSQNKYRHQELKKEGISGIKRQIKLIETIKEEYQAQNN